MGWLSKWFGRAPVRRLEAPGACVSAPARFLEGLEDPVRFVTGLGLLHEAGTALVGLPCGASDTLKVAHEEATYGAMWAYADGSPGHHIGIPSGTWPSTIAAANRRQVLSPLVHELGHVCFWWDWDAEVQAHYLLWPGAVEGLATPTGTYACVRHQRVPAWTDDPTGGHDWASIDDWANQWINQGLAARARGARGQDSVEAHGHGAGAAIVEGAMLDLLFYQLDGGYEPLRAVVRDYVRNRCTRQQAQRTAQDKMEDFFAALGRASGQNLGPYLQAWGFEVPRVAAELAGLKPLPAAMPSEREVRYGPIAESGWC